MYQSIYYDRNTKQCYLRDSIEGWKVFKYYPQVYKRISKNQKGALPVLTGGYCLPIKKGERWDWNDPDILEKDINPEVAILRDLYYENDESVPESSNVVFLDIETEMGGALTVQFVKDATKPLTSISMIDVTTKTKICFVIDKDQTLQKINKDGKIIIPCKNEKDLILKFIDKFKEFDPTILVTWNGEYFDIPYLYYRICNVFDRNTASQLSPIGQINVQTWNPTVNNVRIAGVNHLDYYLLFKKYITKEEPSYKLGVIGEKYVKLGKIEYEGNLDTLFRDDIDKFIEYNIRDVEILEALEEKMKFIDLTILISHICNTPYEQVYYSTTLGEGAILKHLKRLGIVSPNKPTTHNPSRKIPEETYAGGYLLEPTPGLYNDVIDLDFTSLYPSIIKSLNLGIETLIGRIYTRDNYEQSYTLQNIKQKDPNEIVKIERLNKQTYKLETSETTFGKLIQLIEDNKFTISASGAMFDTSKRSAASTVLELWFNKREYYRQLKKKAGKSEDWDKYKLYDLYQHAFKILQNGHYGTYAKNMFRYTDGHIICSAAITNCGQVLTKQSIDDVNEKLNKEHNTNKQYILISDTDSLFIHLSDILKTKYPNLTPEEKISKILKIADDIQNIANEKLNTTCKDLFNIDPKTHYFQLKQEVVCTSLLTTGKRRYGMWVTNKEGVKVDELTLVGLEVMKSNSNVIFKKFGEQFIKDILFGKSKKELDKSIIDLYKQIKETPALQVGKPSGVSYIKKCIARLPGPGEIFSEFVLNTKENSKAAIIYNDLLKFKKLDKQYESIIEGDKIFIFNLKPNPYHITVIGIPNNKIPPDIAKFIETYIDYEQIFESSILKKLKELYIDIGWKDFPPLNEKISKFFSWD
jgi:DNA polymerase elongation subunit (family B)